jgi:hypothetical protein
MLPVVAILTITQAAAFPDAILPQCPTVPTTSRPLAHKLLADSCAISIFAALVDLPFSHSTN